MSNMDGCQLPNLPHLSIGLADHEPQPIKMRVKRALAKPWNYHVKKIIKRFQKYSAVLNARLHPVDPEKVIQPAVVEIPELKPGDWVRVRSYDEIMATLNSWKELKGCAFLDEMRQYCDTNQRVLQPVQRFLDERDYKVKKCKGLILLEGVLCRGTPVFGRCDRCCHLFWRIEWLEIIKNH